MNGNEVSEKFGLISRVNSCIKIKLGLFICSTSMPLIPLNFINSSEVNFGLVWAVSTHLGNLMSYWWMSAWKISCEVFWGAKYKLRGVKKLELASDACHHRGREGQMPLFATLWGGSPQSFSRVICVTVDTTSGCLEDPTNNDSSTGGVAIPVS